MSARSGKIKAGEAFIELYIKDDKLKARIRAVRDNLFKFGKRVAAIGAVVAAAGGAIIAPFVEATKAFAESGEALTKMSERTGVATTTLSKLDYIARQSGTSLDDVEKAIRHFQSQGRNTEGFLPVLESIAAIPNSTVRAERALHIFGKRGTFLLLMIESLHTLGKEFDAFGRSKEQIKLGDELATQFTRLKKIVRDAMMQLAASVAPAVKVAIEWFIKLGKVVAGFIRDFPILARVLAELGIALLVAGTALVTLAGAAIFASAAFAALDVAAAPWIAIAVGVAAIAVEFVALQLLLYYAVYRFLQATSAGRRFIDLVLRPIKAAIAHFADFGKHLKEIGGALADALRLGEIGKAWEILTLGMAMAWHELTAKMVRDLIPVLETLKTIAKWTGQGAALIALNLATNQASTIAGKLEASRDKELDEIRKKAKELAQERAKNDAAAGRNARGPHMLSSAIIGFSSRAAMMSRNVVGGGPDARMYLAMSNVASNTEEMKKILNDIRRMHGLARFR